VDGVRHVDDAEALVLHRAPETLQHGDACPAAHGAEARLGADLFAPSSVFVLKLRALWRLGWSRWRHPLGTRGLRVTWRLLYVAIAQWAERWKASAVAEAPTRSERHTPHTASRSSTRRPIATTPPKASRSEITGAARGPKSPPVTRSAACSDDSFSSTPRIIGRGRREHDLGGDRGGGAQRRTTTRCCAPLRRGADARGGTQIRPSCPARQLLVHCSGTTWTGC